MNTQDLADRLTFSIECYDSVLDDDPSEVWFSTEPEKEAILEAFNFFKSEDSYQKIEVRTYDTDQKIAVLYR